MKVSSILYRSADIYPQNNLMSIGNESTLTYIECFEISKHYQAWIENLIMTTLSDKNLSGTVDIVLAFFSHNSPELILAMIAAINLPAKIRHDNESTVTSVIFTIKIAMINVRWSSKEIAQAFKVKDCNCQQNKHCKKADSHVTIILHGKKLKESASRASEIIKYDAIDTGIIHESSQFSIPSVECIFHASKIDGRISLYTNGSCEKNEGSESVHDDAIVQFTSGTTSGSPKGVRLSHLSLMIQAMAKNTQPCSYDQNTRILATTVPFFHVGGISSALAVIMAGGVLIFSSDSMSTGFKATQVIESMKCESSIEKGPGQHVNTLVVVPAMLHAIICEIENGTPMIYSGVRLILIGGQSITQPLLEKTKAIFPEARIVQTFAATEAGSSITFGTLVDPKSLNHNLPKSGYAGVAPHHIDLKILELDSNNQVTLSYAKPGTIGAIATTGPHVMNGYWTRGYLECKNDYKSGRERLVMNDLGCLDKDNRLYFCGRSNDVIRTGGENVFAMEVESVLIQHPNIDDVAVFALPHERFGECVSMAVILKSPVTSKCTMIDVQKYRDFCFEKDLSGYKRPIIAYQVNEFPRNSSGKVLKRKLVEVCAAQMKSKL